MTISFKQLIKEYNLRAIEKAEDCSLLPGSLKKKGANRLFWLKNAAYYTLFEKGFLILSENDYSSLKAEGKLNNQLVHLISPRKKPRLLFSEIVAKYFDNELDNRINEVEAHRKNKNIYIGENVFIGKNVQIGNGTSILHNSVINRNTVIGENCTIKENCTIGTEGLGFEYYENKWVKFPQIGGVIIGDKVSIGPHTTVRRAALDDTIINDGCKIGAFSNIGHNCEIGKDSILTCQCVIGGSTVIGSNLYMGVQSCTRNGLVLGDNITIGHGAVVTKNFKSQITLVGNPAEPIEDYKQWSTLRKKLMAEFNG